MVLLSSYRPETCVFVLDACDDPGAEAGKNVSRLELIKQSIGMFAQMKSRVNPAHKYGLAVIRDGVTWEGPGPHLHLTSSPDALMASLRAVQPQAPVRQGPGQGPGSAPCRPFDLGQLVGLLGPLAVAEAADGARLRVVLFYCRSTVLPTWITHRGEGLAVDVLFVHDKAAAAAAAAAAGPQGCPSPQHVFNWLEDHVEELSGRAGHHAYIMEAGSHLVKKVVNLVVCLIAHPRQRPPQRDLRTVPLDLAAMPPQPTSASTSTTTSTPSSTAATSASTQAAPTSAAHGPLHSQPYPMQTASPVGPTQVPAAVNTQPPLPRPPHTATQVASLIDMPPPAPMHTSTAAPYVPPAAVPGAYALAGQQQQQQQQHYYTYPLLSQPQPHGVPAPPPAAPAPASSGSMGAGAAGATHGFGAVYGTVVGQAHPGAQPQSQQQPTAALAPGAAAHAASGHTTAHTGPPPGSAPHAAPVASTTAANDLVQGLYGMSLAGRAAQQQHATQGQGLPQVHGQGQQQQ